MKALVLIPLFAFSFSANAEQKSSSACAKASQAVAKQMFLGTSDSSNRDIKVEVKNGFDENSELVFAAEASEWVNYGHMAVFASSTYKVIAKGSEENCEILSITKLSNK